MEQFPETYITIFIEKYLQRSPRQEKDNVNKDSIPTIWIQLPYIGIEGNTLEM